MCGCNFETRDPWRVTVKTGQSVGTLATSIVLIYRLLPVSNIQVQNKASRRFIIQIVAHMPHILATSLANMSLILKSGDVELNPGPGRFPGE